MTTRSPFSAPPSLATNGRFWSASVCSAWSTSAIGHGRGQPRQLDGFEIGERDRRHDLHFDRVGEVRFAGDNAFDGALLRRQHHFGLGGELETAVVGDLAVGLAHRGLDHLGHGGLAVKALEMRDRNLAGPKTPKLHAALEIVEPLVDSRLQIGLPEPQREIPA